MLVEVDRLAPKQMGQNDLLPKSAYEIYAIGVHSTPHCLALQGTHARRNVANPSIETWFVE